MPSVVGETICFEIAHAIIQNSNLRHPELSLLQSFLKNAVDREVAATYFINECSGSTIEHFLVEWKSLLFAFAESGEIAKDLEREITTRDGNRCCISRVSGAPWNPLIISSIIPLPALCIQKEDPRYELLGAFLTPPERDRLLTESVKTKGLQNHWLLSRAASEAFHGGEVKIYTRFASQSDPNKFKLDSLCIQPGSPVVNLLTKKDIREVNLNDHSKSGIDVPDPYLLAIHYRFAPALRWAKIAKTLASTSNNASRTRSSKRPLKRFQFLKNLLHGTWLKVPSQLRLQVYKALAFFGARLFASTGDYGVQRLPFNMYLKHRSTESGRKNHAAELRSLQIIREQTTVPVPRPIDLIQTPTDSYLIQSRIPGHMVGWCIDMCSDAETDQMVDDLRDYITQLRCIRNPFSEKYKICNSLGKACMDWRIDDQYAGPFATEAEFSEQLRLGIAPDLVHRSDHKIVFTHGDLNMRNILMKDGRITGIVDWETAGWYPEYWDLTKVHFTTKIHTRWLKIMGEVFKVFGDYQKEVEIEKEYQNLAPSL